MNPRLRIPKCLSGGERLTGLLVFPSPQATFKASKFAVSPDQNYVLLGYDVKQVSELHRGAGDDKGVPFICLAIEAGPPFPRLPLSLQVVGFPIGRAASLNGAAVFRG